MSPAWRPVRIGLALLVALQIVGLNLWAFHQQNEVQARRNAIQALVKQSYPRVADADIQRDAAAVMLRETQALRTHAGKPADSDLEPMLQAGRSLWNLRQFDLARRTRGARAIGDWARQAMSPAWRPVRIGLALLVALQIVGLNVWAWHQKSAVESRRAAIQALVKKTFPRVADGDVQRDPAAVMLRETQTLRTLAGKAGDSDLEPMLQAAAAAWPGERPPVETVRFEGGKLSLAANGWSDAQIEQFRSVLRPAGVRVDASEGRLILTRGRSGGAA